MSTVELRYSSWTQEVQKSTFTSMAEMIYGPPAGGSAAPLSPATSGDSPATVNWFIFRMLCHLAVSRKLDWFL
ncbi:SNF2-related protein [Penicillium samsonianum]|uniref:SNF2-related protein n=1 Tax=Penicillium samsonianum TaxID=1882272 RepID=UPI002548766B|nr:SNF2-related protein [Penicillium samsonianum]KAJ6127916.1 SNF2-related protein [Penicillium samsonianum]